MSYQSICRGLYKKAMKKQAVNELLQMVYRTAKKVPALKSVKNVIDNVTDKTDKEKAKKELPAKEQLAGTKMDKKASSEHLRKLASLIGMRKRAQEDVKNGTTVNDYFSVTTPDGIFSPIEIKPKASAQTLTKEQYNQMINRIRSGRSPYYEPPFWQGFYADLYEKGNGGLNRVSQKDEGWRNPTYDMVSMPYRLINRTAKTLFNK